MKAATLAIGGRQLGEGQPCLVVAHVGTAHEGKADAARRLIDAAFQAGADAIVFPVFRANDLVARRHPERSELEAAELKRVAVAAFEPVSSVGRAGVDELAQQTRDLLSGTSAEIGVFPRRIAFNVIPQVGDFVSGGRTRGEWLLESQIRRVLDLPDLPIAVTSVYIPAFFGQACAVWVETASPLDAAAARALLREAPGILVPDGEDDYPTLADVIGSEATVVGRVRDDPTVPFGLALWVAVDGLRKGAAVNAVQIAERALRERA